ncbi:16S rRNA (cytosine(967)-C(5))-methyltransferase RsmB [Sinimarinibacterium sp. CAU 1509]|uniref:16S rRNA (cytosine(967)-C(5))-methyltransferase RsmB n=1 Tax=Sinimarinibacterium sp. CAU 1509 TaxID=2562283 RepID=UPI0010AB87AD|nr:16S rRNA (cytosine(967)-C(5))-methyltransferase RsmB [Sinimarinibacterium sp. CAU 1509]TJY59915.1 16S rRNA (cytosine(967)-C(5))-methyltransferase RsmB [Sinimarinibacterium sp. CAU 1509]
MTTSTPKQHPANVRAVAATSVSHVLRGSNLDDALRPAEKLALPADAAMVRLMAYGVLRELTALQWIASRLMDKPLTATDNVLTLILVGLYQLRTLKTPPHAAINETVDALQALRKPQMRGVVNAVLRRYTREAAKLEAELPRAPATRTSHPQWLVDRIKTDWPQQWEAVLQANNQQGPMSLRVNRRRMPRDEYLKRLGEMNIAATTAEGAPDAVVLAEARSVERVPGFNSGQVSVQDASAQLAVELMDLKDGQRVLDACAAPGGKTAHMLERAEVDVVALDSDGTRLLRVDENLQRLKLKAQIVAGDAGEPARWWDKYKFDRILLDAPCSGTGVIRRHPDIKWLRRDTDIPALQQQQLRLLKALWPLLKSGGRLVYATCSVLRDEGDEVIKRFKLLHADAQLQKIDTSWGEATEFGRRIAPGGAHDGFYYAVLSKR